MIDSLFFHITLVRYTNQIQRIFYSLEYATKPQIACWPAGHASGGFALLSLFFLFRSQKNKIKAITLALVLGWSMGIYKMMIGDHFLSHTIITMLLAWIIVNLVNLFLSKLFDTTLEYNKG
ncbi:MAG: phosphatase PAP2 family protein [Campylobacterales bacterium]|nr:phosphatase PAP2 family protein [Campylobacterales bacterium]